MEKVNDLFKAFRAGQLKQDDIFKALLHEIQRDPRFCQQAIALLDQVQRSVPIPVTDFIELRAKVDKAVALQASRQPAPAVADPDATSVYQPSPTPATSGSEEDATWLTPTTPQESALPEATLTRSEAARKTERDLDATIPPPVRDAILQDSVQHDTPGSDATVIMPVQARNVPPAPAAVATETPSTPQSAAHEAVDDGATLIAPSTSHDDGATLIAPSIPSEEGATLIAPPDTDGTEQQTAQTTEQAKQSGKPQPDTLRAPLRRNGTRQTSPILLGSGIAALLAVLMVGGFLLSGDEPSTSTIDQETPSSSNTIPASDSSPALPDATGGEMSNTTESTPPGTASSQPALDTHQETDTEQEPDAPQPSDTESGKTADASPGNQVDGETAPPDLTASSITETHEPEPALTTNETTELPLPPADSAQRMRWYYEQLSAATQNQRLLPADEQGTATYYLVEMLTQDPDHELIPDARATISRMHTELARQARLKGQWDRVQEHLDAAMEVNLPSSYRP